MLTGLVLLILGKLQDVLNIKPLPAAIFLGVMGMVQIFLLYDFSLGMMIIALMGAVVFGAYVWGYLTLLDRFRDNLLAWLGIYLGGALIPVILSFMPHAA